MIVLRRIVGKILRIFPFLFSDKLYVKLKFYSNMGYMLDLNNPQTFCEKLQWLKLNRKNSSFFKMVDKVEAKLFVSSIIGEQYIIPTLGVWQKFDDIDFNLLPDGYILKCTHDSSKGVVVKNRSELDIPFLKKRMEFYQKQSYYKMNREYPYKDVPHRIIAEKFLVNGNDSELKDYKFYCFNGKAKYCQLIANRTIDETIDFFDRNWVHQDFIGLNPKVRHASVLDCKPENYDEMLAVADKLATAISHPFVRIDLYNVNGKVYFGEITFFPNSGTGRFRPSEWDLRLGEMIIL